MTGQLFCVPVLLKDNYDAVGMNTTAGCEDLRECVANVDAPVVQVLKKEGAVILGKANLHELALEGLSVSSLGGQVSLPSLERIRREGQGKYVLTCLSDCQPV